MAGKGVAQQEQGNEEKERGLGNGEKEREMGNENKVSAATALRP